jgi:HK97 family phage prohead protease
MRVTFKGETCFNTVRSKDHRGMTITRDDKTGLPCKVSGYAIVFNSESESWGTDMSGRDIREIILPEAVADCLKGNPDIRLLADHDSGKVLARTASGTLSFTVDDYGVKIDAALPDTTCGRDTSVLIDRGDIDGMSFGFRMDPDMMDKIVTDTKVTWVIKCIDCIREFSIVAWPAYADSSVECRSLPIFKEMEKRDSIRAQKENANITLSLKTQLELHKRQVRL